MRKWYIRVFVDIVHQQEQRDTTYFGNKRAEKTYLRKVGQSTSTFHEVSIRFSTTNSSCHKNFYVCFVLDSVPRNFGDA